MPVLSSYNVKFLSYAIIIINLLTALFSFNILVLCHFLYLSFSLSEIYLVCATYSIIPLFLTWSLQLYITSNLSTSLAPWPSVFVTPALSTHLFSPFSFFYIEICGTAISICSSLFESSHFLLCFCLSVIPYH